MKGSPSNKWFKGVDSIRFILAFIVMLSHFGNVYANALKHSSHALLKYGGFFLANAFDGIAAVIAFFIISGFVIHYPNKNGIPNLKAFWVRRFLRILIPLAVILIIGNRFNHPEKTVVWSLYCELIYYAIYPFLAKIKLSWKTKFLISYVLSIGLICFLASDDIAAFFKQTNHNYDGTYRPGNGYFTWLIGLPCWLLGVLIAEKIDGLKQATFRTVLFYRVIVFLVNCFCLVGQFHLHLGYILTMNIFALLLYKWIQTEIVYFKTHKPIALLERMGKFSYSLYLCHPLLYVILGMFITYNAATYPIFILLTIGCAYGFYLLIERPAHIIARKINSKYNPSPSTI